MDGSSCDATIKNLYVFWLGILYTITFFFIWVVYVQKLVYPWLTDHPFIFLIVFPFRIFFLCLLDKATTWITFHQQEWNHIPSISFWLYSLFSLQDNRFFSYVMLYSICIFHLIFPLFFGSILRCYFDIRLHRCVVRKMFCWGSNYKHYHK